MAYDADVFGAPAKADQGFDPDIFGKAQAAPKMEEPKPQRSALLDSSNAIGTGYWKGMTRLAGLPTDTVANVIDLGKAALGSGYQAVTGKPAPDALQLGDRSKVFGSGDWLLDKLGKTEAGRVMTVAQNPDYEGGFLQAGGAGLGAVMAPSSGAQAVNQGLLGVTSALGGKAVMDATGNPALAVAASLVPSGVQQAATAGTKAFVRGGEAGRQAMEQRIQDLKNAGVENPTVGLASGNKMVGGVENLLQNTPGAVGVMGRARDQALAGLQAKADQAADLASTNRGTTAAGMGIQRGLTGDFKEGIKTKTASLYDKLDQHIPGQQPTPVNTTMGVLDDLTATIPNARNVSQRFVNGRIKSLSDDFRTDTEGAPSTVMVYKQPPKPGGGLMNEPVEQPSLLVNVPAGPPTNKLPWEAVKKTRTMVGNELADGALLSGVPDRQWRALYGGLSEDMGNAARATSPEALGAFNRATDYNRAAMGRLERVAPFANAKSPEQAFNTLANATQENGALSTLQAVKKSLPQDVRGQVAGTVIERLGKATSGQQNNTSTAWSPETFLTNWNKMTPKARQELFSGFSNSTEVAQSVENVAQAASMMRDSSKMWANPSGSGANIFARGVLGALGAGGGAALAGLVNPMLPVGAAGAIGGANLLARGLTSQNVVNSMVRKNYVSPGLLGAQVSPLFTTGLLGQQPQ